MLKLICAFLFVGMVACQNLPPIFGGPEMPDTGNEMMPRCDEENDPCKDKNTACPYIKTINRACENFIVRASCPLSCETCKPCSVDPVPRLCEIGESDTCEDGSPLCARASGIACAIRSIRSFCKKKCGACSTCISFP